MTEQITFPVYRKYKDGKTYFKVTSYNKFEEIKITSDGSCILKLHEAKIHPDRVLIGDMIFEFEKYWDLASKDEYESLRSKCD